ncbi:MAG: hypothetical protein MUF73_00895 [Rhodobacteraceae bacterium]|nr:hypothetical protein [Paracoccaceae bacterium]
MRQIVTLLVVGFVVLTVLYLLISVYSASVRRERLEKDWDDAGRPGERSDFVRAGMDVYRKSLRRRLILLVYVLPVVAAGVTLYLVNYY